MLYRILSSIRTSVYILTLMTVVFLVGTVFPQGENIDDYIKAGGKYVPLVSALDFLDVFSSPAFLFLTGALMLNLSFCLYDRLILFLKIKRRPLSFQTLKNHEHVVSISGINVEERLKKLGFSFRAESKNGGDPMVMVFEKGLPYWWLSWAYHAGIMIAIIGFFVTSMTAFEKEVVLYPDKPVKISLYSEDTGWNRLMKKMGIGTKRIMDEAYVITLRAFNTEYYQGLKIDYPGDTYERIKTGIGLRKLVPLKGEYSFMSKMWQTLLDVKGPDGRIYDAEIKVNKPFRMGSLTLYQMGYEQYVRLIINGRETEVEARVPFKIEGDEGKFVLGTVRHGTLYKKDGSTDVIVPVSNLYYIPYGKPAVRDKLGRLKQGESLEVRRTRFELAGVREGSYLSYRKDPGVFLVGVASLFVFIGLIFRCLGAWYRVQCSSEKKLYYVLISSRGILADRDRVIKKLNRM